MTFSLSPTILRESVFWQRFLKLTFFQDICIGDFWETEERRRIATFTSLFDVSEATELSAGVANFPLTQKRGERRLTRYFGGWISAGHNATGDKEDWQCR